jgi:hypothetical protein
MVQGPAWGRAVAARPRTRSTGPLAGILFVAAMGAAFWVGVAWASQPWWPALR